MMYISQDVASESTLEHPLLELLKYCCYGVEPLGNKYVSILFLLFTRHTVCR